LDFLSYDIVIVGSGIAGLRAAIEATSTSNKLKIAVITKVQAMRSHSVSAEGGTAAALYPEEGDSAESHVYDTIKGSDFLADQDAVERLCSMMPAEIYQLEHWGMPWSRNKDGRIAQRHFGGYSFPRAVFAGDKVGFFEMQTLYDTALKYDNIEFLQEWFVTSILKSDNKFQGLTAIEMKGGDFYAIKAKAGIIATGGPGRLYSFATYGHSSTAEGLAMVYRAGIALKDMEFVQFHPTGLCPSGILITEGARGDGGVLVNKNGERFMARYAPEKKDLATRDVVSRAIMDEINQGRGVESEGLEHVYIDLRHLGAEKIKERLSTIREIAMKFNSIDPIEALIPVRPVCHYFMGGIDTNIDGATKLSGLWAAGECACISVNGANRMGANSTAECLVWGKITGAGAAKYAITKSAGTSKEAVEQEQKRIYDEIFHGKGGENPYEIKKEMQRIMDRHIYVYRNGEGLLQALKLIRGLKKRAYRHADDKSREYNTNFTNVLELDANLEVSEAIVAGALARTESRGAHARIDYPKRDDKKWLKHTLAYYSPDGTQLDYSAVIMTKYKPVERKY
jgi:succinate dehydrogenase / fumarate reductase flavoprotein subunit